MNEVTKKWQIALKPAGYEHHVSNKGDYDAIKKYPRAWRRILKVCHFDSGRVDFSALEVGCGGGRHLATLSLNGWRVKGIDVSTEVLSRATNFFSELDGICDRKLDREFIASDFLDYEGIGQFDLVFHVGVIEHFPNEMDRVKMLKKMLALTKVGGYVVSIVPSGTHPLRSRMKRDGLGGYDIPEIDYTPDMMIAEFGQAGARAATILPHSLFGYLLINNWPEPFCSLSKALYYPLQSIPAFLVPYSLRVRHSSSLIGIVRKED